MYHNLFRSEICGIVTSSSAGSVPLCLFRFSSAQLFLICMSAALPLSQAEYEHWLLPEEAEMSQDQLLAQRLSELQEQFAALEADKEQLKVEKEELVRDKTALREQVNSGLSVTGALPPAHKSCLRRIIREQQKRAVFFPLVLEATLRCPLFLIAVHIFFQHSYLVFCKKKLSGMKHQLVQ